MEANSKPEATIQPGDGILFQTTGTDLSDRIYTVAENGTIVLCNAPLKLAGLTVAEAARAIEAQLQRDYKRPVVRKVRRFKPGTFRDLPETPNLHFPDHSV